MSQYSLQYDRLYLESSPHTMKISTQDVCKAAFTLDRVPICMHSRTTTKSSAARTSVYTEGMHSCMQSVASQPEFYEHPAQ